MKKIEKELEKNGKVKKNTFKEIFISYFDLDGDGEVSLLEIEYKLTKLISIFKKIKS